MRDECHKIASSGLAAPLSRVIQCFHLGVLQSTWHLFITDCARPRSSSVMLLVQCIIFFTLFANFYRCGNHPSDSLAWLCLVGLR